MRDMQRAYHRMLKEDQGTVISNTSMARRLLRRSGLTLEEQRQVLSSCGHDYDLDKIKDALRLTYGDTHKDDHRRPFHRGASSSSSNNHGNFNRKNFRKPFKRRFGTNAMDTVNEEYDETQEYEDYYPDGEEEYYDENPDENYDDEHEHPEEEEHEEGG